MGELTIRDMREEDCAEVSGVVCTCFGWAAEREGYTPEQIVRYSCQRGSEDAICQQYQEYQCLVACAGQPIVGMVAVKGNEVTKLYVDRRFHRRGVGTMLFNASERIIRSAGHREMVLGAVFDSSVPFYKAMGMSAVGRRSDLANRVEGPNAMIMKKPLQGLEEAESRDSR